MSAAWHSLCDVECRPCPYCGATFSYNDFGFGYHCSDGSFIGFPWRPHVDPTPRLDTTTPSRPRRRRWWLW